MFLIKALKLEVNVEVKTYLLNYTITSTTKKAIRPKELYSPSSTSSN
jgi:hypothetical protein